MLQDLLFGHVCHIPFENLSVLLEEGISLEEKDLEHKLVTSSRGGYCFEQNGIMLGILNQIGFDVKPLAGRVRIDRPRDFLPPRTHLFLIVTIGGKEWIYDAGVGSLSLTAPILFELNTEQSTPHESRRIVREDGAFFHQAFVGSEWKDVYEFSGELMPKIDREVSNWWTSTCPEARFSQNLMASLSLESGERIAILNDRFTRKKNGEILEAIDIRTSAQLIEILANRFGLHFAPETTFGRGAKPWPTS